MKYLTENSLYIRNFKPNQNHKLAILVINNNKKALERLFYDNCMVCSWTFKNSTHFVGDLLYCKGIGDNSTNIEKINQLFCKAAKSFIYPTYEEYVRFYEFGENSISSEGKILNRIKDASDKKLDRDSYTIELESLKNELLEKFTETSSISKPINTHTKCQLCEVLDDIEEGNLAFMGFYQRVEAEDIKKMLTIKLIEKCYGFGETGSIYNYYRTSGNAYVAYSSYIAEENIFYTGVFSSFSKEIFFDVSNRTDQLNFNEDQFNNAKKKFIDDLLFSYFQYGEQMTTLQYTLHTGNYVCLKTIIDLVHCITLEDLSLAASQKKHFIKVVM